MKTRRISHGAHGSSWRQPIVSRLNIVGFAVTALLLGMFPFRWHAAALPLAVLVQYALSFLYQSMPQTAWREKLDRSAIFVTIGATYVPYWVAHAADVPFARWYAVALCGSMGILTVLVRVPEWARAVAFAVYPSMGLIWSWSELRYCWLPTSAWWLFWIGALCYLLHFLVFATRSHWPQFKTAEATRHVLLLFGTMPQCYVALTYT